MQDQKKTRAPYSAIQKQELISKIRGRSKRECEVLFATIAPQSVSKESERVLTQEHSEVRFILNEELRLKLQKIKFLVSHQNPSPTYAELLSIMSDIVLKKLDPERQKGRVVNDVTNVGVLMWTQKAVKDANHSLGCNWIIALLLQKKGNRL